MEDTHRTHHPSRLYVLAFLLALAMRLIGLGALPLNDAEAASALQALQIAQGERPLLGAQPAYVHLTAILFFVLGATNFLARLVPALSGSALVFVPYLFRQRIRPRPGLILAFGLALDPGLFALSRQAGSAILAATFLPLAWGLWQQRRPRLAGVCAGLMLLSGPALWPGLLGLGLAWLLNRTLEQRAASNRSAERPALSSSKGSRRSPPAAESAGDGGAVVAARPVLSAARLWLNESLSSALLSTLITLFLVGTLFFVSPSGLSVWLGSLPAYLQGWARPSGVTGGRLLMALIGYEPLPLLLGLAAVWRGWAGGRRRPLRLSLWLLAALLLALLYPGRQVADLLWVLLPLWALAAGELGRSLDPLPEQRAEVAGVTILTILVLAFAWFSLTGIALDPLAPVNTTPTSVSVFGNPLTLPPARYILLTVSLLLLAISLVLVAYGWSLRTARLGALYGYVFMAGLFTLSAAISAGGLRAGRGFELWSGAPRLAHADLLLDSVNDLSQWSRGHDLMQPVVVSGVDSPALLWLLREREMQQVSVLDAQSAPPLVITPQTTDLGLASAYRGQDFLWREEPAWEIVHALDWLQWTAFRQLPYDSETIILWARLDLFPDGRETAP